MLVGVGNIWKKLQHGKATNRRVFRSIRQSRLLLASQGGSGITVHGSVHVDEALSSMV